MQNGHNSRNNGFGRIHHTHHGHSNHHGTRNRDLKLNVNNGKSVIDNSMLRSEKERQRQEARAQRERSRVNTAAQSDKKEALFAVVQVSPNPSHDRNQISDILGDFSELSKHQKTLDLIGVDHQPATPAPIVNAHLHDPDNYPPPPPFYNGPRGNADYHNSYYHPHRSQPYGVPGGPSRPSKQTLAPPNQYKIPHQQKYAEEVKPSLKSGPGPGPGPGTRSFHDRVPPLNGVPQNEVVESTASIGRGRPRSQERAVKDPQIQKIMSEMNDLKSPLSAILQTPRPDHQSSFTFPTPVKVGSKDTSFLSLSSSSSSSSSSSLSTSAPSLSSSSGFRLPNEPPLLHKSGKSSENRTVSTIPSKALESNMNHDEFRLSEDSEEEEANCGTRPTIKGEPNINSVGPKDPSVSPMKNTDESSNSGDSSGSDSESSSTEDEGRQSPAPASPTPSDKNPWSLANIFQQNSSKDESLAHEIGFTNALSAAKGSFDSMNEVRPEPMSPSPHSVDEPAPPVVTTIPSSNSIKSSKGNSRPLCSPTSTDESSDGESPIIPKGKKSSTQRTRNSKITPSKVTKKIIDPILSSESEDEEVTTKTKPGSKILKQPARSPKIPPPLTNNRHQRKPPKRKKDAMPSEKLKVLSDSESDVSVGVPSSGSEKHPAKISSRKSLPQSLKSNVKITHSGDHSSSKKLSSSSYVSQTTNVVEETRPKASTKDVKYNGETKCSDYVEKVAKEQIKVESSQSYKKGRKEEDVKLEKKRRKSRRHHPDNTEESEHKKPTEEGTESEINHRLQDERVKLSSSSSSRKLNNVNSNNNNNNNNVNSNNNVNNNNNSASYMKGLFNINKSPVQWENGVPKLLCSIPLHLIDNIPIPKNVNNNNNSASVKDDKVNKEVLEMRTSGGKGGGKGAKSNHKNRNSKSPPNEDEKKLRALNSIYKKQRQSSLEPDRIKHEIKTEVTESQDDAAVVSTAVAVAARSPLPAVAAAANNEHNKTETKSQSKEESKSFKPAVETCLKRPGSSLSLPSASPHSKKHKKDKRKERDESSRVPKAQDSDFSRRRKRTATSETDISQNRSRENSRESTRSSSKSGSSSQHETKKPKLPLETDKAALNPAENIRDARLSPHPRPSQQQQQQQPHHRNASEERPASSLSSETIPPYQSRQKPQSASSQFSQRSGSHLISPYLDHESEEDLNTSLGTGDGGTQRGGHPYSSSSAREKLCEDSHVANSGDTSEYHSLPSSEHGGSTYRNGEEHSSPPLGLPVEHLYSQEINPSPGPSMEYNKCSVLLSQDPSSTVTPRYISYFEKPTPEVLKDNTQYLNTAKELKHLADKERHRVLQTIMYLEAVLYFILTGDSMESDPNTYVPSYTMYNDTFKLIRHVSSPIYKSLKDGPHNKQNVILTILSLRCQSLLSLKLFSMKRNEMKEALRVCCDFLKVNLFQGMGRHPTTLPSSTPSASCAGGGTPSGAVWGGSQRSAANNSPSSLSPTPSPAGSVGSEGSQSSSGYSTEGTRQRGQPPPMGATPPQGTPLLSIPPDVQSMLIKHCHLSYSLNSSHEMWSEADDLVYRHDMKDFFIELDHAMGPLTLHSSLRELVRYVQTALDKLKKLANTKL